MSAAAVLLAGLGRVVQDLLLWCTVEFGYLRLADGFVQSSSIMPQKRNPVALEHARAIGSKALGQAAAITLSVHNTPFGDIVDTEDDLQPLVASMFRDAVRAVTLVGAAMRGAEFDVGAARGARRRRRDDADRAGRSPRARARPAVHDGARHCRPPAGGAARAARARRSARSLADGVRAICSACRCSTPTRRSPTSLSPRHFVEVRTHARRAGAGGDGARARRVATPRSTPIATWLARSARRAGGRRRRGSRERSRAL